MTDTAAGFVLERGRVDDQRNLGLPGNLEPNWLGVLLEKLGYLVSSQRTLLHFLETCVRCGVCADKCPVYLASGQPEDIPAARAELLGQVYRRYFTRAGRILPTVLTGARDLNLKTLLSWLRGFDRCLTCRRCAVFCPLGLDPSEVTLAGREILAGVGLTAGCAPVLAAATIRSGNSLDLSPETWSDLSARLEREVFAETGVAVRLPVDEARAEVLLLPAAADLVYHPETMIGYAKTFHVAGISWTTCSQGAEAANFGFYLGQDRMSAGWQGIVQAIRWLKPRAIVWGESGHGWRVGRNFFKTLSGYSAESDTLLDRPIWHITQLTLELLKKGIFQGKLDQDHSRGLTFTYHDPCHVARSTGLFDPPRAVLQAAVADFREMPAETIREWTHCCGAGGGLSGEEARAFRQAVGSPRAEAFKASGADVLVTICQTCRQTLPEVLAACLGREVRVAGVMELFGQALTHYLQSAGLNINNSEPRD